MGTADGGPACSPAGIARTVVVAAVGRSAAAVGPADAGAAVGRSAAATVPAMNLGGADMVASVRADVGITHVGPAISANLSGEQCTRQGSREHGQDHLPQHCNLLV